MRLHTSRFVPLAAFSVIIFATGCSELNATVDKAQVCLEAPKIVTETVGNVSSLLNDPPALQRELDSAGRKLGDLASKASDTTLREATNDLATSLGKLNVNSAAEAAGAIEKVGTDTAAYLTKLKNACS